MLAPFLRNFRNFRNFRNLGPLATSTSTSIVVRGASQ